MKNIWYKYILILFPFIFQFHFGSEVHAQTIKTINGMVISNFSTKHGEVTTYLPADLYAGETICGTVTATPAGKNLKQKQKELNELKKLTFSIVGPDGTKQIPLAFTQINAEGKASIPLNSFIVPEQLSVTISDNVQSFKTEKLQVSRRLPKLLNLDTFTTSTHVMSDSPLCVYGPFDGNSQNTSCLVDGQPVNILAESPRQCIVQFPKEAKNVYSLTMEEKGKRTVMQIQGVEMNLSTGKLNLLKGESTYLDISVTGLQNLHDTAILNINNLSATTVNLLGGNAQTVRIPPQTIIGEGTYNKRFNVSSLNTGPYSINAELDLPKPEVFYNLFCDDVCTPVGNETGGWVTEVAESSGDKSDPDKEGGAFKNAKWLVKNTDLFGATGNEESALDAALVAARTRGYVVWIKYCWEKCENGWWCTGWVTHCSGWIPVVWVEGLENTGDNTLKASGGKSANGSKVEGLTRKEIRNLAVGIGNNLKKPYP
jgi:hypothetical protein